MIAIYDRKGSFSDRWISVCRERRIPHIAIDLFDARLFEELHRFKATGLLSHPDANDPASALVSKTIVHACMAAQLPIFPRVSDFWHFDDKVAQKYLFDALGIETPSTHVFLDRNSALAWIETAQMPLVFKLKAGAGSINVSLLRTKREARARVKRMFGQGYAATDAAVKDLGTKIRLHHERRDWIATIRRSPKTLSTWLRLRKALGWERHYAYLQEFIPGNDHDTRVTIIGGRAFAFRRAVRPGDFRASGSGKIVYDPQSMDLTCVRAAFDAAKRLRTSCIAFDFIKRPGESLPLIVEMSYAFAPRAVFDCPGHWRSDMSWHAGQLWPQDAILDDFLAEVVPGMRGTQ